MQWLGEDEAAVDFAVLWTAVVVPVASIVDWRLIAVVMAPVVLRLVKRRVALRQLIRGGISSRSIQQALQWVDEHEERRSILGALRSKAYAVWRSWIGNRYVKPFAEADSYQLLAEREVEQATTSSARRNAA
jgi:hypothetical protein